MSTANYNTLIQKLDDFIRKYYKNLLIRGVLYALTLSLLLYLSLTTLEYFAWFGTGTRTFLFWSFIAVIAGVAWKLIIIPITHIFKLGKIISYEQAAEIIGTHFADVKDKLLNTLQLHRQIENYSGDTALLVAGIEQKISVMRPVPFTSAIDLKQNRKYLRYLLVPVVILAALLFTYPTIITESTARLLDHGRDFEKPAPFKFVVKNASLESLQTEDFLLELKLEGQEIPDQVYIEIGDNQFKINKEDNKNFNYLFRNLQKTTSFRLFGGGFYSRSYELIALPNPLVLNFDVQVVYPPYLKKENERIPNAGDLVVPQGTRITWSFRTRNTEHILLNFGDSIVTLNPIEADRFNYTRRFMKGEQYTLITANKDTKGKDSLTYQINVIPDQHPTIAIDQQADSTSNKRLFFRGQAMDDYGFSKLTFNYKLTNEPAGPRPGKALFTLPVTLSGGGNREQFFYMWDMSNQEILPGQEIEYYFEVFDNDGVNGPKSSRSQSMVYKAPTEKELAKDAEQNRAETKDDLKKSMDQAKKLQRDIENFQKKMVDKKELGWEDKKRIEDMLKTQQDLQNKVQEMQRNNELNTLKQNEFKKPTQELLDKQKQLEELLKNVMSDEMKKLMEELQKLLSELDKAKVQEMMDKMKMENKDLSKELDRSLEIFKQMEFEQKLDEATKALEKLAKKQDDLSKKSDSKDAKSEDVKKEQDELNKEFDELSKDMKDLEKKNQELQFPNDFQDPEKEKEDIKQDMENSSENLSQQKNKKASQSQKQAAQKMQDLANKMQQQQASAEMEQMEEDMAALRELLENLIKLSFDQEALMQTFKTIDLNDPRYIKLTQDQRKLRDDAKMIEDSLFALSKRVPQIASYVNKEIAEVNDNMDKATQNLQDRQTPMARSRQQFAMTSVNNLTLMLSEVMDQMQQAMAQQMPGSQSCQKPGKGKPSPSAQQLKDMQKKLNDAIKQAKDAKNPGKTGEGGQMSQELAKMAAMQEAIRNELQKMNQQQNKDGQGSMGNLDELAKKMEETETDLYNKRITQETIKRQEDIMTRLLEAEKAERERDEEERRQARDGKNAWNRNPTEFEEYKRQKLRETELLRTVPPSLRPYYKQRVSDYFQNIQN